MAFHLSVGGFVEGDPIPRRFSCDGENTSPSLQWSGEPKATQSFALIMDDPDAPAGTWNHWLVWDISACVHSFAEGDAGSARQFFTETVMLRPDSSDGVRGLAALALEQNEYEEALELHERLIEMGERSPEVFYNAGLICQKRGQFADAVSFYQQAIDVDPQFAEALLNMGHAQMALGAEDQALNSWRRAIKEKPSLADSYFEPVDPRN